MSRSVLAARRSEPGALRGMELAMLVAAGLAAAAIWLPGWSDSRPADGAVTVRFVTPADQAGRTSIGLRPLFDPARGRVVSRGAESVAATAPTDAGAGVLTLRGLVKSGDMDVAIIEERATQRFHRLQKGQAVGDWYLAEVRGDTAVLRLSGSAAQRLLPLAMANGLGRP